MNNIKVKLISANFKHAKFNFENSSELDNLEIDVFNYDDSNFPSRSNSLHPRLKGKIPKMLGWMYDNEKEYDYYVWSDSKFHFKKKCISELVKQIKDFDMCLFKHPHRSRIIDEYNFVKENIKIGNRYLTDRYDGENMEKQMQDYISDKNFNDNCLFACGLFIYSKKLIANKETNLLKEWFFHNVFYSIQDQLSLPYLVQKFKINYTTFDFDIFNNAFTNYG
jgi:hypothetical protein